MRDLLLWRLLRDDTGDSVELVRLLEQLAKIPVGRRFAFLGWLEGALSHESAEVRAAAVAALSGVGGQPGLKMLVAALDDESAAVRRTAVESLRRSAESQPGRWAHVVFHPRADVRAAALSADSPRQARSYSFYLLGDPESVDQVGVDSEISPKALGALLDFVDRGAFAPADARRHVADFNPTALVAALDRDVTRAGDDIEDVLHRGKAEGSDCYDRLFRLFWDAPEDEAEQTRKFFGSLMQTLAAKKRPIRKRVAAAVWVTARRSGAWIPEAAGLSAVCYPMFLGDRAVDADIRRAAAGALFLLKTHVPKESGSVVDRLLRCDIAADEGGKPDLFVCGAVLRLARDRPYAALLEAYPLDHVVEAFVSDPERNAPFLMIDDGSDRGRKWFLANVGKRFKKRHGMLLALVAWVLPADELNMLEELTPVGAVNVATALLELESRPEARLTDSKVRRLSTALAQRIGRRAFKRFLESWLDRESPELSALGVALLGTLAQAIKTEDFVDAGMALPLEKLRRFLVAIPFAAGVPYGKERALAGVLVDHLEEDVRAWARERVPEASGDPPAKPLAVPDEVVALTSSEKKRIATCAEADLADAVSPCIGRPRRGLAAALRARPTVGAPSVDVCVALLGCHDEPHEVAEQFERFRTTSPDFMAEVDARVVLVWESKKLLPPLGHAWLFRWERHAFAFGDVLVGHAPGVVDALRAFESMPSPLLRVSVFDAAGECFAMWAVRERRKLRRDVEPPLVDHLVDLLDTEMGEGAARMLAAMHRTRSFVDEIAAARPRIDALLPDVDDRVRLRLSPIVDSRGLPKRSSGARANQAPLDAELIDRIRRSTDVEELIEHCRSEDERIVEEAVLRLVELGGEAPRRLAAMVSQVPPVPGFRAIVDSATLWTDDPALDQLRALTRDPERPAELRFRIAVALLEREEEEFLEVAFAAATEPLGDPWLTEADWDRLVARAGETAASLGLAASPHPHAYRRAIEHLLTLEAADGEVAAALHAFLDAGTERLEDLRLRVAHRLKQVHDLYGFPLLLQEVVAPDASYGRLFKRVPGAYVDAFVEGALVAGGNFVSEARVLTVIEPKPVDAETRERNLKRLLLDGTNDQVAERVVRRLSDARGRDAKLTRIAEVFAWGVRTSIALTGRLLRVHMSSRSALGYTRLGENRVYVSPLPMLRSDRNGEQIVEGLILHEFGHHRYHRGKKAERVWKTAEHEGIFGLLNIVADEHLERNLRALDSGYGDRLKRLDAYAFQHSDREVLVNALLAMLGSRSFDVLSKTSLGVALQGHHVSVNNGKLLLEMERVGMSFTRFFRALRMGLGDRHGDPRVADALDLFGKGFRKMSMPELLEIARELRKRFGAETLVAESFGGHETLPEGGRDSVIHGEGIGDPDVQREVERVLDPDARRTSSRGRDGGKPGKLWINVKPDEHFDKITRVEKLSRDGMLHRQQARLVLRHARRMRGYLEELGLARVPRRMRLRGHKFDRTRARAVVTRGDPRMLVARELVVNTDLFLGVIVDCSGSMQADANIDKARAFAVLLSEAAKNLDGIDLRMFGFTDRVIYDAGDAQQCAATSLEAGGGNNDAAALYHAASVAKASRRRAKLLVMISDGLPTECSAQALKALVTRLTKKERMCCAQVAVRPLEEVCFSNYIELREDDLDASVRRFGAIVAGLVRKAIGA